jgi:hypothetical protein
VDGACNRIRVARQMLETLNMETAFKRRRNKHGQAPGDGYRADAFALENISN